jgi:hypothetical protein
MSDIELIITLDMNVDKTKSNKVYCGLISKFIQKKRTMI